MDTGNAVHYSQWIIPEATGIDALKLENTIASELLGDDEVAVELHAASLNYRELVIAKACSDGAGIVKAVGSNVRNFQPGDRIVTHMTPRLPDNQPPTMVDICAGVGHSIDGTLRQYGHFQQTALVHAPKSLAFEEAATLTCSGLTAFNALFGLRGREVKAGDWVLVQGTGGVSIAALQFAVAAGANVIATTSSELKTDRLKALGAKEVVNYRSTPAWGQAARESTPNSRGYDFVVDIAGDVTLRQSIEAVRTDGVLVVAGMVGGAAERGVPIMSVLAHPCIVRGIILGTREQFREMVRFVDEKKIQPVVDEKVFALEDAKEAMRMLERQEHFSKVIVKLR